MLRGFILAVHILLALLIIGLVLLQRGKGAEAGAGFGSGASGTVFGARGTSTLFSKLTGIFAAMFFGTSLLLAYLGTHGSAEPTSVLERAALAAPAPMNMAPSAASAAGVPAQPPASVPATPAPTAVPPASVPAAPAPAPTNK